MPASVWWLLGALALLVTIGIPLLVRSRRGSAWKSGLAAAEDEVAWLARDLVPEQRRSGSRQQAAGGWAVSSERVRALEDRLTALQATSRDEHGRGRALALRDAVRAARASLENLVAPGCDQSLPAELDSVAPDLESVLRPVARS